MLEIFVVSALCMILRDIGFTSYFLFSQSRWMFVEFIHTTKGGKWGHKHDCCIPITLFLLFVPSSWDHTAIKTHLTGNGFGIWWWSIGVQVRDGHAQTDFTLNMRNVYTHLSWKRLFVFYCLKSLITNDQIGITYCMIHSMPGTWS